MEVVFNTERLNPLSRGVGYNTGIWAPVSGGWLQHVLDSRFQYGVDDSITPTEAGSDTGTLTLLQEGRLQCREIGPGT